MSDAGASGVVRKGERDGPSVCERGGCDRPVKAKGLCQLHYDRERSRHRHREDRVLPTRARNRAVAALVTAHKEEFDGLLAKCEAEVCAEDERIRALAKEHGVEVTDDAQVFRLKRGPIGEEQAAEDRAILQRAEPDCPFCDRAHERGHACPECGTRLGMPVERATSPEPVRDLADELIKRRQAETAATLSDWDLRRPPPPEWDDDDLEPSGKAETHDHATAR